MTQFKEGDLVKIKEFCSGCGAGKVYPLHWGTKGGEEKDELYAWDETVEADLGGCSCQDNWELVSKSGAKLQSNVQYIATPQLNNLTNQITSEQLYKFKLRGNSSFLWGESSSNNLTKKTLMSKIIDFAKNLCLSADEKLFRKHGLKNECGYTTEYEEVVKDLVNKEYEPKVLEIVKQKENEDKK